MNLFFSSKPKKKKKKFKIFQAVKIKVRIPKWHQKKLLKRELTQTIKKAFCALIIVVVLDLAFNLLVLITGAIHVFDCPMQPLLPLWLIIVGK